MNQLDHLDLQRIVNRLPKDVAEFLKADGNWAVAGGFIRASIAREPVSDIDLFFIGDASAWKDPEEIAAMAFPERRVVSTANALTLLGVTWPVQLIERWSFREPSELLAHFDFTIAQALIWHKDFWRSACGERFYVDVAAKRLIYTNPPADAMEPGASMLRALKFVRREYHLALDSLAMIIARAAGDESKAREICAGLVEVDPNGFVGEDSTDAKPELR